jgi:hypothetical protein
VIACLRPADAQRRPAGDICFADSCVLLGEDCTDRLPDALGQSRIRLAAMIEAPGSHRPAGHLPYIKTTGGDEKRVAAFETSSAPRLKTKPGAPRRAADCPAPMQETRRYVRALLATAHRFVTANDSNLLTRAGDASGG